MKALMTILITLSLAVIVEGQEKKDLAISSNTALLNNPFYKNSSAILFNIIDYDYHMASSSGRQSDG
jgi:hypothetical protein